MMSSGNAHPFESSVVMVVDDNPALLESLKQLLELERYQVEIAIDGQQALDQLYTASLQPDLILSDVAMPNMDGFRFFEMVRNNPAWVEIPFVFLTARDQLEDLRRGYSLGADDYVVKPFDQERLLLVIRSKLQRSLELRERLAEQQRMIEQAKHDLASMVAHELRTPLASITIVSDLLGRELETLDPEQRTLLLESMQRGSSRLNRLVEQMVMYVQMESGSLADVIASHARPVPANELVKRAVANARRVLPIAEHIPVRLQESGPDLSLRADPESLTQAITELVHNGLNYSPDDGIVDVRLWQTDHGYVCFQVADNGCGIPPEEIERVKQPFYQFDRRSREQQGIGIGLTLAERITLAHRGQFELRSQLNAGTEALMALPCD